MRTAVFISKVTNLVLRLRKGPSNRNRSFEKDRPYGILNEDGSLPSKLEWVYEEDKAPKASGSNRTLMLMLQHI